MEPMNETAARCQKILETLGILGTLIHQWAEKELLTPPIIRAVKNYLEKLNSPSEDWVDEVVFSVSCLKVMGTPRLAKRFQNSESSLPHPFTGDELQILNNVQYYKPWSFGMYWLLQEEAPGLYLAEEVLTKQNILLYHPHISTALASDKELVAGVVVPSGTEQDKDDGRPAYTLFGSFAGFNSFLENDPEYLLTHLAQLSAEQLKIPETLHKTLKESAAGLLILGAFGSREEFLEDDEELASFSGGKIPLPLPGLDQETLAELETHLHRRSWKTWELFEGMYGDDTILLLYNTNTRELFLRSAGIDSREAYKALRLTLVDALTSSMAQEILANDQDPHHTMVAAIPLDPPIEVGLICGFAARDLFDIPLISPPDTVIQAFDLAW